MTCPESLKANHEAILKTGALQEPVATLKAAGCADGSCTSHEGTASPKVVSAPAPQQHKGADCPTCG